jgi:hypothetical protein
MGYEHGSGSVLSVNAVGVEADRLPLLVYEVGLWGAVLALDLSNVYFTTSPGVRMGLRGREETCRRLKIPARQYLAAVLPGLANLSIQRLPELTPTA